MAAHASATGSPFVTSVAWLFIVLSALVIAITALQCFVLFTLPAMPNLVGSLRSTYLVLFASLALNIAINVTSVALLRRRHWAHRVFSALIALCFVFQVGALGLDGLLPQPSLSDASDATSSLLIRGAQAAGVVLPLVLGAILLWIWIRLQSVAIRDEFHR